LDLEPLGRQDFATLASATLGGEIEPCTLHRLWSGTAGNVLFLRELVADAVEAGTLVRLDGVWRWAPDGRIGPRLAELVADRMGRLEGDRRLLAELLAVGEPLGAELLQKLVQRVDLADEERRGTIVAEESGRRAEVRLAHPLFGEVLRSQMPLLQRRRLQRLLADSLEAVGGQRRGDVLRSATWRMESASPVDAGLLLRAARRAREVFDFALAARLAGASWELAPSFETGLLLGASLIELGQFDAAGGVLDRLAGTEHDGTAHQLLARERAWVMFHGPGGLADARRVLEQAEASVDDPVRRLLARADLAKLLTYAGRLKETLAIGGQLITPDTDVRVRLRSLAPVAACVVFAGRADQMLALCDELEAAADRLREELPEAVGWVWMARTNALLVSGRLEEVTTVLAGPLEPEAAPIVGAGDLACARTKLGRALLLQGRPADTLRQLTEAAAVLRANELVGCLVWCLSLAAEAHALLGHMVEAGRLAEEAMMRRPSGLAVLDGDAARARAWVTAAAGERSRAIGQLITAADDQESRGQPAYAMFALHDALRLGARHVADRLDMPGLVTLTRREQEVAALACHGLSNADIAGKLVISVRTVESHLYSAYGKLGVSNRAALAAVLGSQ
jgi:DNA-binding CsgD family transcriptional regulator